MIASTHARGRRAVQVPARAWSNERIVSPCTYSMVKKYESPSIPMS